MGWWPPFCRRWSSQRHSIEVFVVHRGLNKSVCPVTSILQHPREPLPVRSRPTDFLWRPQGGWVQSRPQIAHAGQSQCFSHPLISVSGELFFHAGLAGRAEVTGRPGAATLREAGHAVQGPAHFSGLCTGVSNGRRHQKQQEGGAGHSGSPPDSPQLPQPGYQHALLSHG